MSEPMIEYPLREVLGRIETKLDSSLTGQDALKERVLRLELRAASSAAVRTAIGTALASPIAASIITWWLVQGK